MLFYLHLNMLRCFHGVLCASDKWHYLLLMSNSSSSSITFLQHSLLQSQLVKKKKPNIFSTIWLHLKQSATIFLTNRKPWSLLSGFNSWRAVTLTTVNYLNASTGTAETFSLHKCFTEKSTSKFSSWWNVTAWKLTLHIPIRKQAWGLSVLCWVAEKT